MKLVLKFVAIVTATLVGFAGIAHAADLASDAVLGSTAATPTEVTVGDNSFEIKVWATGRLDNDRNASVVTVYNMATNGTITPDTTQTQSLFYGARHYSQQCGGSPAPLGCAGNPHVVTATLKVATGTPVNTVGALTVDLNGAPQLEVTGSSEDKGHVKVVSSSSADTTDPSITSFSINDAAAWTNTTGVTVDIAASDNVGLAGFTLSNSPITSTTPAVTQFASTDLAHTLSTGDGTKTVYVRVFDAAGNYADSSATIGLDTVEPVISSSTGSYTPGTWTNQNVVVSFTCADPAPSSGLAINTVAGATVSTDGGAHEVANTGVCTDNAGNEAAPVSVVDIKVDKTAPVVSVTGVAHGSEYTLGSVPTAGCSTTDALSDVADHASLTTTGGPLGSVTATCSGAKDHADNTGSASVTYTIVYDFAGFFRPVEMGALNRVKAGSAVPVKFSLGGDQGMNILSGSPKSVSMVCQGEVDSISPEETVTAGSSSLQYDATSGQYTYVWKTDKAWTGCRQLQVKLADGTTKTANFQFTK